MIRHIIFLSLLLQMTTTIFSQQPPIEPGVSKALAEWRAKHYGNVKYKLNITLEKGAPLMKGDIEVSVTLDDEGAKNDLILDWRTTQFANDKDKPFANVTEVNKSLMSESKDGSVFDYQKNKEHLIISKKFLKTGENSIKIKFASPIKTSSSAITRYIDKEDGSEYIYSLFVPSDASTAFPVFDQPDLKARFKLGATIPSDWKFVTNTEINVETRIEIGHCRENCYLRNIEYAETKPISSYVFAFATGNFDVYRECIYQAKGAEVAKCLEINNKPEQKERSYSKIYVRKSQAEKFKPHAEEVFRINRECIKYLEEYFDYKFPFPKYDMVLIPEFPFGGMEHAGATFLRESSIIFPQEPTKNDYISRATLIFHETAHQWFGDLVTMKWFDDLWLKEGFATFMGFKALDKIMPEMNAWKAFYERNKVAAYQTDSTKGTVPIYQDIPNLSAAKSAYGAIVYSKAPSFLKQAEFYLGEKEFQTAVRSLLKKYEFKNATWQDLVTEFEIAKKEDLKDWANKWVKLRGLSRIKISQNQELFDNASMFEPTLGMMIAKEGKKPESAIFNQQNVLDEKTNWIQNIKVIRTLENEEKQEAVTTLNPTKKITVFQQSKNEEKTPNVSKEQVAEILKDIEEKRKIKVKYLFPNYQDYGYGIFLLDEKSRNYILANVQNEKDDFLRSMMYGSLWDSVREAELNPEDYVELVIKNVANEKDETIVSSMLNRANTALNYYFYDVPLEKRIKVIGGELIPDLNDSFNVREGLIKKLEKILINKMQTADTLGQRITFFRSFLNVVSSEKGREVLKQIQDSRFKIQGFNLKTKDKFDIVTRLIILGDKDAPKLLGELTKTETSDDAKRYAYAAQAGIATAENKAKFWNDFVKNKEISESWIESAFGSFNSIRHADLTVNYLEQALAELPNHKKNRKIFFVNGWLGAFIGGQKSEKALEIVNKFLADNPNLDKDLRLKILENVDVIERAVKIRKRFGN